MVDMRDKPLLIGWNRSPYARRVAISLNLLEIPFDQEPVNAWDSYDRVLDANPIAKVPTLITEQGEAITESWAILDWLDHRVGPDRALMPPPPDRTEVRRLTALAGAVIDKGRELRYERHLRPARLQYSAWIARWSEQITSAMHALDAQVDAPFAAGDRITQADVTIFVMVESIRSNHQDLMRPGRFPELVALHRDLAKIDAFAKAAREDPPPGSKAVGNI